MKLTKLQNILKLYGIAARRFALPSQDELKLMRSRDQYDVYLSDLVYAPWVADAEFLDFYHQISTHSLVSPIRCWILYSLIKQSKSLDGEFWECGVYKGGTALLIRMMRDAITAKKKLRLFDSFEGMPETNSKLDVHKIGDFSDTSLDSVRGIVGENEVYYHAGFIPKTYEDLDVKSIAFAHIDLDLHDAILESCRYIYPRLVKGGMMIFDDYGFPSCPGAKIAIDNFFGDKPEFPLVLPTAQAVIHKL
jgi:O-methyltransferase